MRRNGQRHLNESVPHKRILLPTFLHFSAKTAARLVTFLRLSAFDSRMPHRFPSTLRPVRVHGSVHDYFYRICLQNLNVSAISVSTTLKSPSVCEGFTGQISKISNETSGVHGFTGPEHQGTPWPESSNRPPP